MPQPTKPPLPGRVRVPTDLSRVTLYDPRSERAPGQAGVTKGAVEAIWRSVETLYRTGLHPGIALALRCRGHLLLNRAIGHATGNEPGARTDDYRRALTPASPICLFSASNAVTALLAHRAVDRGWLELDAPSARYLPAFAAHGKARITVRDLLTHRAGIPAICGDAFDPALLFDWDAMVDAICRTAPSAMRTAWPSYHALTAGFILGEILQRVSGQPLQQLLRSELAAPLGCRTFRYGLPPADRERYAHNAWTGSLPGFPLDVLMRRALGRPVQDFAALSNQAEFLSAVVPSVNVCSTAEEVSRLFQMLLDGGTWQGRRILSAGAVAAALRPAGPTRIDGMLLAPMRYSAGFMLGVRPFGLYGADCARAFGHLGYVSSLCWADPKREIAVALLMTGKCVAPDGMRALWNVLRTIERLPVTRSNSAREVKRAAPAVNQRRRATRILSSHHEGQGESPRPHRT